MTELFIDDALVQWAVGGQQVTTGVALEALAGQPLLVLLHGYGSHEGDLIGLAHRLPHGLVCASLRAPLTLEGPFTGGYSWWQLQIGPTGLPAATETPETFEGTSPHAAAVAVLAWLDRLEQRATTANGHGISSVSLMGFSQGGAMVTSLLRLRPDAFACAVNTSGFVAPGVAQGDAQLAQLKPAMFWGRDEADPIIDRGRIDALSEWAATHTRLEAKLYPGAGHGINLEEMRDVAEFLTRNVTELGGSA